MRPAQVKVTVPEQTVALLAGPLRIVTPSGSGFTVTVAVPEAVVAPWLSVATALKT